MTCAHLPVAHALALLLKHVHIQALFVMMIQTVWIVIGQAATCSCQLASSNKLKPIPYPDRFVMQRRLRIVTKAVPVAATPAVLYQHAQADCILCLLMHKVSQAAKEEGLEPARQLLQDWLVRALARYNLNRQASPGLDHQTAMPVRLFLSASAGILAWYLTQPRNSGICPET